MPLDQKVLNAHLVELNHYLENKDYENLLKELRLLGLLFGEHASIKNLEVRESIFSNIEKNRPGETASSETLITLLRVLNVWDDTGLKRVGITEKGESEKRQRQLLKFKGPLDKNDRRAVHIGLYALTLYLTETQQSISLITTQDLINLVSKQIKHTELATQDKLKAQQEIEKIGHAISSFLTPNKTKKFIKYTGILLALIASSACGLATGGAIFLVFPSLPILGIVLGTLIGLFGFSANFGFFSQNFPNFLLSFLKKGGGISEYIDAEGKRQQLSRLKKYLFIPLALLASLTVGVGTVAITYSTVLALAAKLLPILAIIWPPLPLIIVGILSAAIGITLTVAVLTATIEAIKNSQDWSWESIKNKFKSLTTLQILGYVAKGLLVLVGLFGLAYFRYTAGLDLYNLIIPVVGSKAGLIAACIMGTFAYVPQAFFTIFSIQKLFRIFSPSSVQEENISALTITRFSRIKSIANTIYTPIYLIGNAVGNAALVVVDSISAWSISGAIGCFFNSWSGNIVEKDPHQSNRNRATKALVNEMTTFNTLTSAAASAVTNDPTLGGRTRTSSMSCNDHKALPEPRSDPSTPEPNPDPPTLVLENKPMPNSEPNLSQFFQSTNDENNSDMTKKESKNVATLQLV